MNNKIIEILEAFRDLNLDILALSETWLEDGDIVTPAVLKECGFTLHGCARKKRGGGVAILAKSCLKVLPVKMRYKPKSFECMEATIEGPNLQKIRVVVIYRPPSSPKPEFLNEFEEFLTSLNGKSGHPLILGDFNIHTEDESDKTARDFEELLLDERWEQHVEDPTHEKGATLDLVISRDDECSPPLSNIEISRSTISDHYAVTFLFHAGRPCDQKKKVVKSRKMKSLSDEDLAKSIAESPLAQKVRPKALDELVQLYDTELRNILDELAPMEERVIKDTGHPPWYNKECEEAKRKRRKAERDYLKTKKRSTNAQDHHAAWLRYKKTMKDTSHLITTTRDNYYRVLLEASAKNPSTTFGLINKLLGREKIPQELPSNSGTDEELAGNFGKFFKNKIETLYEKIELQQAESTPTPDLTDMMTSPKSQLSSFKKVSDEELTNIIKAMSKKHCELDPIPTGMLVKHLPQLLPVVSDIVNGSLQKGLFPDAMKKSLIRPSYKKKDNPDPEVLNNYRPVSNLSFLSKVIEKCVALQITKHLEENDLLPRVQSAYRQNHSTETTLAKVVDDLLLITDSNSKAILVLLDLSAAFDTINHQLLLGKLKKHYGITGKALEWLESYLEDRKASVRIGHATSTPLTISIGVPQGSILGPLLFVLYTKELEAIAQHHGITVKLYADDTQLYLSFKNDTLLEMEEKLQNCLHHIRVWMSENFLKLNPEKTEIMVLARKRDTSPNPDTIFTAENQPPTKTSASVRNLGAYIDPQLNFSGHVSKVVRDCSLSLMNLWKIGKNLTFKLKIKLVNCLVHSRIDYCNSLLANISAKDLQRLQKVQNGAARFIFGQRSYKGSTELRKALHFLPVKERVEFKLALLTYKTLNDQAPGYLRDLLTSRRKTTKHLRSDTDETLLERKYPRYQSTNGAFSIAAPKIWNTLPRRLRESPSVDLFKKELKTHLFKEAYCLS